MRRAFGLLALMLAALSGCGPTNNLPELNGEFAYVANAGDGTISVFAIDSSTGRLSLIESVPAAPGARVFGLALHWSNEFLYATIDDLSQIDGFAIGDANYSGQIFARTATVAAADGPRAITLDPSGNYLYATNYGGEAEVVNEYQVDQHNGALTPLGTAPTGARPFGIAVSPDGGCAYVVNVGDHSLSAYAISGGTLSPVGTVHFQGSSVGQGPELVAVHDNPGATSGIPAATIYVTDDDLGVVHQISPGLRTITGPNCGGEATDIDARGKAFGIAIHPTGKFLYTGNSSSNSVTVFSVDTQGRLTPAGIVTRNLAGPLSVAVDLSGKYLYAANFDDGTVAQFAINQTDGALTALNPPTVATQQPTNSGAAPVTIVTTQSPTQTIVKPF
jgi:6-phosphogluconolactonase